MTKVFLRGISEGFCILLNWLPVLHLSCDKGFGQYIPNTKKRFSLLAASLGGVKIYFLTLNDRQFSVLFSLKLSSISPPPDQKTIDAKTADYLTDIDGRSDDDVSIQYEFLKENYNNNCNSRSSLETKVSSHASTYLVLAGFYAYVFNELWKLSDWQYILALTLYLTGFLFLASAGIFIFTFFRIGNSVRAAFRDLKPMGKSTIKIQSALAYTNWYASNAENRALATYVKNIELNMAKSLAIVAPLWLFIFISNNVTIEATKGDIHNKTAPNLEISVVGRDGKLNKQAFSALLETLNSTDSHKESKYVILSGTTKDKELYSSIISIVRAFADKQSIIELHFSDQLQLGNSVIIKIEGATPQ
jgi:hypothetical protein